ncbi:DUF6884 domain-containing protein [Thermococcus sp.]|uniref:DUF6884 domain-containing protein n=1 Tax=Thermococcus sp. TaxID=35749 RepID=UPI0025F15F74|nr:DUF6884 domain-containing protein [Thermococcus sp.]
MNAHRSNRIIVITACGNKKSTEPGPAWKVYKSSRIRYLYRKSQELGYSFYVLSAKYGLIHAETIIEPYNEILNEDKVQELLPQVLEALKQYDVVIYYAGGARKSYKTLIQLAAGKLNKDLIIFGYANMGDINKIEDVINCAKRLRKSTKRE